MIRQEILEYIKKSKESGQTNKQIKTQLLSAGWPEAQIDEALPAERPVNYFQKIMADSGSRQRFILAVSLLAYLVFFIFSSPAIAPIFKFNTFTAVALVILSFWLLGYGARYVYLSVRRKAYDVRFFILIFLWVLSMIPFLYALFQIFKNGF